jgi:hypothetical protein
MKKHIWTLAAVAGLALSGAAWAQSAKPNRNQLDLANPADAMIAWRKIQCSATDAKTTFYHWSGRMYARPMGQKDQHIFNVEGFNVRHCGTVTDAQGRTGVRLVTREIMLYLDPKTGQVLRTWKNPWTGKDVDVVHVANDPVNQPPAFNVGMRGMREDAGKFWWNVEVPLFYANPLAGDYQQFVGNHYQAIEMFNFIMDKPDLLDRRKPEAYSTAVSWVRVAQWLPWMEMGSLPGIMIVNATGSKLATFEELPDVVKDEVRKNYPTYLTPPPLDDKRPNETSWTVFQKYLEAKGWKPEKKGH